MLDRHCKANVEIGLFFRLIFQARVEYESNELVSYSISFLLSEVPFQTLTFSCHVSGSRFLIS